MKVCYCLLNHTPTLAQHEELHDSYGVSDVIFPDEYITNIWRNIPTTAEIPKETLDALLNWLSSMDSNDIAWVQGEMTATYWVVSKLQEAGIKVIASVTERKAREEIKDGKVMKISEFEHIRFRYYRK